MNPAVTSAPMGLEARAGSINEAATLLRSPHDGLRHTSGPNPWERSEYPKAITPAVAIKHINKALVTYQSVLLNGELHCAPLEMILMVMTAGDSVGENAVVSPLAWTDLDDEVLLIMERPENCMNLFEYNNGQIDEGLAKEFMRQLVEAAIQIHEAGVFHGTSCSWSPEFNHQETYEAGPTTVWQLGSILLELLSENTDLFTTGMQHCEDFLTQTIKKLKVSEDCKKFLKSCLLFNPDQCITLEQMWCHPWFRSSILPEAQP
ncbi:hypothetical protein D4764_04G0014350 [Takifugu flavidus]|uniref:non-specific serine/threonine protein kinase n=1 Tax=Takifugu flavidus TaxID=433684 RepID=A0A5C6N7S0_9TELE|nr:hypothetical protein D4764_04G0014350 [Takifugu flavidus]